MSKGRFITIEGIEGVGKTTNLQFIESWLTDKNIPYIVTREPGGTPLGEQLRQLLLHGDAVSSKTELLLMFAARAQHLEEVILPALNEGKWVICDRFTDSTFAYQGGGRQLNPEWIKSLESLVHESMQPDVTLLLDAPVEIGRARAAKRSASDRIESEDLVFFNRVRDTFLHRARLYSRFRIIDACQPLEAVQENVATILEQLAGASV
ncbi:dTMP kinase [Bermanella sp. R86510]|uniref:dTMP kinase n=1 Tax=unclassified Bermanella TaxID=2627862 RepID=UPI0037C79E89